MYEYGHAERLSKQDVEHLQSSDVFESLAKVSADSTHDKKTLPYAKQNYHSSEDE